MGQTLTVKHAVVVLGSVMSLDFECYNVLYTFECTEIFTIIKLKLKMSHFLSVESNITNVSYILLNFGYFPIVMLEN